MIHDRFIKILRIKLRKIRGFANSCAFCRFSKVVVSVRKLRGIARRGIGYSCLSVGEVDEQSGNCGLITGGIIFSLYVRFATKLTEYGKSTPPPPQKKKKKLRLYTL